MILEVTKLFFSCHRRICKFDISTSLVAREDHISLNFRNLCNVPRTKEEREGTGIFRMLSYFQLLFIQEDYLIGMSRYFLYSVATHGQFS
jgi:hypothetical protein